MTFKPQENSFKKNPKCQTKEKFHVGRIESHLDKAKCWIFFPFTFKPLISVIFCHNLMIIIIFHISSDERLTKRPFILHTHA